MKAHAEQILIFKKDPGKTDRLEFLIGNETIVEIKNPKQGILPHDMIHYAVEQEFPFQGFVQLVFLGHDPGKTLEVLHGIIPKLPGAYSETAFMAESLVEAFQGSLWSENSSFPDLEYSYQKACEARNIKPSLISEAQVSRCRKMIEDLHVRWNKTPEHQQMKLLFLAKF